MKTVSNELILNQTGSIDTGPRYAVLPTSTILTNLESIGFQLESTSISKVRKESHNGFQRHLMRLSHPMFADALPGHRPELIVLNSYNGTSAVSLMLGIFRFACANGIIAGSSLGGASIRHVGDVETKLRNAALDVSLRMPSLVTEVERLMKRSTSPIERNEFSRRVVELRLDTPQAQLSVPQVVRGADLTQDAWTVFNIWQEILMRRGFRYINANGDAKRARPIKSVARSTEINKSLWDLTQEVFS